jgi:hypothetical protein
MVGFFVLYSFAAYEAFAIRRALAVGLHRNQALGIGFVALGLILSTASQAAEVPFLPPGSPGPFGTPIDLPFIYFALLVLFYWIDASIRAGRRSDPLLRDTLMWSKVRIIVWGVTLGLIAIPSALFLYLVIAAGLSPFAQPNVSPFLFPLLSIPFYIPIPFGAVYLPLVAKRSKDPTLRRHLSWFGLLVVDFFGLSLLFSLPPILYVFVARPVAFNLGGYLMYRSARSLVPINRLELGELNSATGLKVGAAPDRLPP